MIDLADGQRHLPGGIRSDDEHDRLAELLMKLALSDQRTAEEDRLIEILERLVDDYDEQRTKDILLEMELPGCCSGELDRPS